MRDRTTMRSDMLQVLMNFRLIVIAIETSPLLLLQPAASLATNLPHNRPNESKVLADPNARRQQLARQRGRPAAAGGGSDQEVRRRHRGAGCHTVHASGRPWK